MSQSDREWASLPSNFHIRCCSSMDTRINVHRRGIYLLFVVVRVEGSVIDDILMPALRSGFVMFLYKLFLVDHRGLLD